MRMTIDEQIKALEYLKKSGIFPFSTKGMRGVVTEEYVDGAIDTMRKYQQIERIFDNWDFAKDSNTAILQKIGSVIRDGNRLISHTEQ